ncbi:hypothetical protein LRR18_18410, partial [Mangrovimonas sp. AS39]|uniref:hypothetical protein n=1 Tax=Mangrovimonas futianensis TaxID=2895523 RepID=UPI001E58DDBA
ITREWEWDKNGEIFTIREYFAQVPGDSNILLNEEHDEFQWLPLPEAEVLLDKESSKNMVTRLQKYIEEKDG